MNPSTGTCDATEWSLVGVFSRPCRGNRPQPSGVKEEEGSPCLFDGTEGRSPMTPFCGRKDVRDGSVRDRGVGPPIRGECTDHSH